MAAERRVISGGSLRASSQGKTKTITGYGAVFNSLSEDIGGGWGPGFKEKIDSHAFDACLARNPDVRSLWNHDVNHILGRTRSNTLTLKVDSVGLLYSVELPDTQTGNDLFESVKRGDVTGSSFGFQCKDDEWDDTNNVRTLQEVELFDVGPVCFPAYAASTVQVRGFGGKMETVKLGLYRSRSLALPGPISDAERARRARALAAEFPSLHAKRNDGDSDCTCECENCKVYDCVNCSCEEGCEGENCGNDDCNCAEHRQLRSRSGCGIVRTIPPIDAAACVREARAVEAEIYAARLAMRLANAR